jgi:hypothetical protein
LFFAVVHRLVPLPITVEGYAKAVRQAKDIFYLHLGSHVVATATAMQHLVSDKEVEQPYRLPFDCTRRARSGQQAFFRCRTKD